MTEQERMMYLKYLQDTGGQNQVSDAGGSTDYPILQQESAPVNTSGSTGNTMSTAGGGVSEAGDKAGMVNPWVGAAMKGVGLGMQVYGAYEKEKADKAAKEEEQRRYGRTLDSNRMTTFLSRQQGIRSGRWGQQDRYRQMLSDLLKQYGDYKGVA